MYVVSNRIQLKKGYAKQLAPKFTKPGPLLDFKGFIKVEVAISTNFEDYDEMSVNTYWETLEDFHAWRNSEAFEKAHQRPEQGDEKKSPTLGNQIVVAEIASVLEKK